jgi:hypothetical protein
VRPASGTLLGSLAISLIVVAGCGGPVPSGAPPIEASPASPAAATSPGLTGGPPDPSAGASAGPIVVDVGLLEILPAELDGIARQGDAETAAEIAAEIAAATGLEASVGGIAVAIYVGALATAADADYAVATVVRLRPGVFSDAWFRDWRDTFDAGVCDQAGGVDAGRSEIEIEGRTVHRSSCVGGVVMHHVHLEDRDVVVSIQGAGPADLGRRIVASLKE